MSAQINKQTTKAYMQVELETKYPLRQPVDFNNDMEAYRQFLLDGCDKLRKQEYIFASERICLEFYKKGMDNGGNKGGKDNRTFSETALSSQNPYTDVEKEPLSSQKHSKNLPDKKYEPATQCAPDIARKCGAKGKACCAVTATAREKGIMDALDIPADDIKPRAGASYNFESLPEEYRYVPDSFKKVQQKVSGTQAFREKKGKENASVFIKNGELDAGDQIAVPSKSSKSGSHSMTIVSVDRDENGNPTGFTVQGNNKSTLDYYPITEGQESGPLINNIGQFSKYAKDKLDLEKAERENMSIQELENEYAALFNRNTKEIAMLSETLPKAYKHACKSSNKNTKNYCDNLQERFDKFERNYNQQQNQVINEPVKEAMQSQLVERVTAQPMPEIEIKVHESKNFLQKAKEELKKQFDTGKQKVLDFVNKFKKDKKKEPETPVLAAEATVQQQQPDEKQKAEAVLNNTTQTTQTPLAQETVTIKPHMAENTTSEAMKSQLGQQVDQVSMPEAAIRITPAQNMQETPSQPPIIGPTTAARLAAAANEQRVQNGQEPTEIKVKSVSLDELNQSVESFSFDPTKQPEGQTITAEAPAKENPTVNVEKRTDIDVKNLSGRQQHDMKMLFLRDPAEANKILGNKSWMNSKKLQEAWDKGEISDEQKQALVEFAGKRFDEKGNFADVDGYKAAAEMEADAKGYSRRTVPTDKGKKPQPEEKVSTADLIALQMRNMRGGRA